MATWDRYNEERKYTQEADTNVNRKHVGEPLRQLSLEDRLELRRQARAARENAKRARKQGGASTEALALSESDHEEDEEAGASPAEKKAPQGEEDKRATAAEGARKLPETLDDDLDEVVMEMDGKTNGGKVVTDLDVEDVGGKIATSPVEDLEALGSKSAASASPVTDLEAEANSREPRGKKRVSRPVEDLDAKPVAKPVEDLDAVVELEGADAASAAAVAAALRRARRKAKANNAKPKPAPAPVPARKRQGTGVTILREIVE